MNDLIQLDAVEISEKVRAGELSARAVCEAFLAHNRECESLNALTSLAETEALARADAIDVRREAGETLGRLAGVPICVKDAICTKGIASSAGSRILQNERGEAWRPPYDATSVERLLAEDAVVLSKANMDEFAMGSSNETSAYGPARNPHDPARTPGGSSGGSAAAAAARLAPITLGSDTGGSIRQPASLCGVVGVKPSYGRVSRFGLIAFASSLDQIGPLSHDVRSSARALEIMSGADPKDSTSATDLVGSFEAACEQKPEGLRVGIPEELQEKIYNLAGAVLPRINAIIRNNMQPLDAQDTKTPRLHQ